MLSQHFFPLWKTRKTTPANTRDPTTPEPGHNKVTPIYMFTLIEGTARVL